MSDHAHNYDKEVDPKQKKPCRACTDFKSWMQMKQRESSPKSKPASAKSVTTDGASDLPKPVECPVDKDELGRNSWSFLHTMAAYYPDKPTAAQQSDMKTFIKIFSKFYPCEPCAADMREDLKDSPPDTSNQKQLSLWFCKLHNKVNKKLGKPEFNCDLVDERWRDGWKDGSCD